MSASLDIAIIGMAARVPGAANVDAFWRNLCDGVESIATLSERELSEAGVANRLLGDPRYVRAAAVLPEIDRFDAPFFGFTPQEAAALDPQHRVFLECAWEAFESAGYDPEQIAGRVGVYAGSSFNGYLFQAFPAGRGVQSAEDLSALLALDKDFLSTRVSYKLNLRGPSIAVQTACSTSLVAVHLACQSLLTGECELALAGGVSISVPQQVGYLYQEGGIASPDGHCRAFDARAQGTVPGSGVGAVLLKPLEDALVDGDGVIAVIKGSAINNDGRGKLGFTAPSIDGQARVIRDAHQAAGVQPRTIGYVEAHGTGTPLGDPIEVRALGRAFGASEPRSCAIGSVKTNVGHLDAAAGVIGLVKAALALSHRRIPKSLHFEAANPAIDFAATPFYVADETRTFPARDGARRAGVSSFGIGGTNAHVVLEEAPECARAKACGAELLPLSARSSASLRDVAEALATCLVSEPSPSLRDVAYTLQVGRRAFAYRKAIVSGSAAEAEALLRAPSTAPTAVPHDAFVALLFPGQGTPYLDATRGLYDREPLFRAEVDGCAALLAPELGLDLRTLLFSDWPEPGSHSSADLTAMREQTRFAQPALFVLGYALAKLWLSRGLSVKGLLGHSVGEYVAACLSGTFSLADALTIVAARGRAMQAMPEGAMLAVVSPERELTELLGAELALAAVNGPRQCVLSGSPAAVARAEVELARRRIGYRRLPVAHAFHSPLMEGALAHFHEVVARATLHAPRERWVSNLTGSFIEPHEACDPAYWVRHLRGTVRFAEGLATLARAGHPILLSLAPGDALAGLARQNLPSASVLSGVPATRDGMLATLARLWEHGAEIDFRAGRVNDGARRVRLPSTPFERQRYWLEAPAAQPLASTKAIESPDGWFYLPKWSRSHRKAAGSAAQCWLVLADDEPLLEALLRRLAAEGARVVRVRRGARCERQGAGELTLCPAQPESYTWLARELTAHDQWPSHVVHGWLLSDAPAPLDAVHFRRAQQDGLLSLLALARALTGRPAEVRLSALVRGGADVTGAELLRPEHATLAAAARSIGLEYGQVRCQLLDLEPVSDEGGRHALVETLLAELTSAACEPLVAYRGRHRWLPTLERVPAEDAAVSAPLRERGVYLITGGLGGVGLAIAGYLARTQRARLVLTARSQPSEATRAELSALRAHGAELLVLAADVTCREAMAGVVREAHAQFGALHGVVHAAGIAEAGLIDALTPEQLEAELAPKAVGALVLSELLADEPLDFVVYCSSLTALSGGVAQASYAAANAFLDAHAMCASRGGRRVLSLGLDRVAQVGMAARAEARLSALGLALPAVGGIDPRDAGEVLARALSIAADGHLLVSTRPLTGMPRDELGQALLTLLRRDAGARELRGGEAAHVGHDLAALTAAMHGLWAQAFGLPEVDPLRDFYALGGESLLALQILNRVRETFAVELSLREFFEHSTVCALAERVHALRGAREEEPERADEPVLVALPRTARRVLRTGEGES